STRVGLPTQLGAAPTCRRPLTRDALGPELLGIATKLVRVDAPPRRRQDLLACTRRRPAGRRDSGIEPRLGAGGERFPRGRVENADAVGQPSELPKLQPVDG